MKKILLTRGKFALVDNDDYPMLMDHTWFLGGQYAISRKNSVSTKMHHLILPKKKGFDVDHRDKNTLNNQRYNLRYLSRSENVINSRISSRHKSGVIGVYFDAKSLKWKANITKNRKRIHLGSYSDLNDAKMAREKAERKLFPNVVVAHDVVKTIDRSPKTNKWLYRFKKKSNKYRCVYKNHNKFMAMYHENNKLIYLGTFETEIEAAKAYIKFFKKKNGFAPYKL